MNENSRRLAAPIDSDMHTALRAEMCETRLLGLDGAARYFVGVLTDRDFLGVRDDSFVAVAKGLTEKPIGEAAKSIRFNDESVVWLCPLFEKAFRERYPELRISRKWTMCDQAIVYLLENPVSSDEQVAAAVSTTLKQLAKCSDYQYLKRRFLASEDA